MTFALKPFNVMLALVFLALATLMLMPHTFAPARTRPVAAVMHMGETQEIEIHFADDPDESHANDCGLTVYLRMVKFMPNDKTDPCTIMSISWQELYARAAARLQKQGIRIDLPNRLSKDVLYALGQNKQFVAAVEQVLNEIAKSQGLGDNVPKYLTEFPFDAFTH